MVSCFSLVFIKFQDKHFLMEEPRQYENRDNIKTGNIIPGIAKPPNPMLPLLLCKKYNQNNIGIIANIISPIISGYKDFFIFIIDTTLIIKTTTTAIIGKNMIENAINFIKGLSI